MTEINQKAFEAAVETVDVFVIGGGPAGSTAATLLAQQGRRVALADKDVHPRFHIGESLLPASVRMFRRLGVEERVAAIGIPKFAAEFVSQYHGRTETFPFAQAFDEALSYSYQVPRAQFDQVLIENAAEQGVAVRQNTKVTAARRDAATGLWDIEAVEDGLTHRWQARFVIDASGRETFFGGKNGWKVKNPDHTSAALYAHYKNVWRPPGQSGGNIQIYWFGHGWFWAIPLVDGVTSIGAVCWPYYLRSRKGSVEQFFEDTIAMAPDLKQRLEGSTRVSEITATGNFTYKCRENGGDGYMLVGDAYGFIDPLFSTGVMLAMESGASAAERVHRILDTPAEERALVAEHKRTIDRAMRDFTWLVYRMPNPIMRDLMMTPDDQLTAPAARNAKRAVVTLLAGDVFSRTTAEMHRHMRTFKLVYFLHCLAQPVRWWRHRNYRQMYLSG